MCLPLYALHTPPIHMRPVPLLISEYTHTMVYRHWIKCLRVKMIQDDDGLLTDAEQWKRNTHFEAFEMPTYFRWASWMDWFWNRIALALHHHYWLSFTMSENCGGVKRWLLSYLTIKRNKKRRTKRNSLNWKIANMFWYLTSSPETNERTS